ncbi:MAG TPA: hypothetical protein VKX34_00615 [Aequorivita sp.]|nr:hypothetical protein [Aequorivita sp.]
MKHETIKKELEVKAKQLLNSSKYKLKRAKGLEFLKEYDKHIKKGDQLSDELTDALNAILKKHNIELKDEIEKEHLIAEMRPVFLEALRSFVKP